MHEGLSLNFGLETIIYIPKYWSIMTKRYKKETDHHNMCPTYCSSSTSSSETSFLLTTHILILCHKHIHWIHVAL